MKYLTIDEIIFIHDEVLKRYGGGEPGIFPEGRGKLDSMLTRMKDGFFGYQPFDTILRKVSFQFQSLLQYHPFVDGIKRTGIFTSISYLLMNDYFFEPKSKKEGIEFAMHVADNLIHIDPEKSIEEIVSWFKDRTFSIYDKDNMIKFAERHFDFTCPRCRGDSLTINSPFCKDCGAQLFRHDINFKGIIVNRKMRLERKIIQDISELNSPKTKFSWTLSEI